MVLISFLAYSYNSFLKIKISIKGKIRFFKFFFYYYYDNIEGWKWETLNFDLGQKCKVLGNKYHNYLTRDRFGFYNLITKENTLFFSPSCCKICLWYLKLNKCWRWQLNSMTRNRIGTNEGFILYNRIHSLGFM